MNSKDNIDHNDYLSPIYVVNGEVVGSRYDLETFDCNSTESPQPFGIIREVNGEEETL